MKKTLFILLFIALCCTAISQPQGRLGAGFVVGEPTGIAWKYRLNETNAVDGVLGFSPYDRYRLQVDYLWQTFPFEERKLGIHYGLGAAFGFGRIRYVVYDPGNGYYVREDNMGFGVRGVVGLDYMIQKTPLDVFFEVAPVVALTPDPGSGIDVGFGMRFYF